jgi:four helix bundle protein
LIGHDWRRIGTADGTATEQDAFVHDFRRLNVWHESRALGSDVYRACAKATRPESRLITAQLRRAALSIATNIAEGCGKSSRAETIRYLEIASGSAAETEHHLLVAIETDALESGDAQEFLARIVSIRRMLFALIKRLPA